MKLISRGPGLYESEDGRIEVSLDPTFTTECDEPHPVKMRLDTLRTAYANDAFGQRGFDAFVLAQQHRHGGRLINRRTKAGWVTYLSWFCEGGETHTYSQWVSRIDGDWTEFVTDTFSAQIGDLEKLLGERISVVRPRRQKAPESAQDAPGDDAREMTTEDILRDELRALDENIDRMVSNMATELGPYVDRELLAQNRRRKAELEALLS